MDEELHGVTLARFARITAAVAEGFERMAVLAHEGLEPAQFAEASAAWKQAIASSGPTGVFARYEAELHAAEDRLARSVQPLDDDPAAWMAFLGAYVAAPEPAALRAQLDLGLNDVSRLSRRWARRIEADERLRERVLELARYGAPPLPRVTASPRLMSAPSIPSASGTTDVAAILARPLPFIRDPNGPNAGLARAHAHEVAVPRPAPAPNAGGTIDASAILPKRARATAALDMAALFAPATPFTPAPTGAPNPLEQRSDLPPPPPPPPHDASGTMDVAAILPRPLPFAPRQDDAREKEASRLVTPAFPDLTVQQYASLVVELTRHAPNRAATLARYGVTESGMVALEKHWAPRLRQPDVNRAYLDAIAAFNAWLEARARG